MKNKSHHKKRTAQRYFVTWLAYNYSVSSSSTSLRSGFRNCSIFNLFCWITHAILVMFFWCRIHLWFRLMGGLQAKSMTSQRYRAVKDGGYVLLWQRYDNNKMADMCYYGNVMTTTRWRICVIMETLWQQQDGGYVLLWKRYDNNKMADMCYYGNVMTTSSVYRQNLLYMYSTSSTVQS